MNESIPLQPELLLAHVAWVRRLAGHLVFDATAADDVAQQTLLEALAAPPGDDRNMRGWLAAVARRVTSRTHLREQRRQAHEIAAAPSEAVPAADEVVARALLQRAVVDAVVALAEPYRTTVLLRYFDELPPREIAARLEVPVETVRTRLKRGLALLRERLARELAVDTKTRGRRTGFDALLLLVDSASRPARVATGTATTGVSATAAGLLGALVMTAKTKMAVVAALVLAGAVGLWSFLPTRPAPVLGSSLIEPLLAPESAAALAPAAADELPHQPVSRSISPASPAVVVPPPDAVGRRIVTGVVSARDGRPIGDAVVAVEPIGHGHLGDVFNFAERGRYLLAPPVGLRAPPNCTRTDADGRYELPAPDGKSIHIGTIHEQEGFALRGFVALAEDSPRTEVDLMLDPGVILEGRVTDEQGAGIAATWIMLFGSIGQGPDLRHGSLDDLRTDAEGWYRSLPLPARILQVAAHADGFVGNLGIAVTIPPGERVGTLDFTLKRAQYLAGRLVDLDGELVGPRSAGLEIEVLGCRHDPTVVDDARGEAVFQAAVEQDGSWKLQLTDNDSRWVAAFAGTRVLDAAEIVAGEAGPDLVVDLEAILAAIPRGSLELHVRDGRDASPVPSFEVELSPQKWSLPAAGSTSATRRTARNDHGTLRARPSAAVIDPTGRNGLQTDGVGHLRADSLIAATWSVRLRADGFVPAFVNVTIAPGTAPTRLEVALLPPTARVLGCVVDELGLPVAGAEVLLAPPAGAPAPAPSAAPVVCDGDGCFELDGLPAGDFFVVAKPPCVGGSYGSSRLGTTAIPVKLAHADAEVRLLLRPAFQVRAALLSSGRAVHGPFSFRLRDEAGALIRDDTRPGQEAEGFSKGNVFKFGVSPGRYTLDVLSQSTTPTTVEFVAAPDQLVRVPIVPSDR